ncbi:SMI1/KNR4 family protein [Streptomyces sp. NPDC004610]|uniref:SMI1/KNR4 family protein n=1 Tax=unclassified Streptomyces TaxID=2593676 RepID=UPI0033A06DD7
MSIATVGESWDRIEDWLSRHAPVTLSRLRPPASTADIEAAQRTLGVTLPDDVAASLRRHDGVELADGTLELSYYGPLSCVADIVDRTLSLRRIGERFADLDGGEEDEEDDDAHELAAFWRPEWLLLTLGIGWQSTDGLFVTCRPGPHHGRPGRYFDEDMPTFTEWPSFRQLLADLADALRDGREFHGQIPIAAEGALRWEDERDIVPDPVSALGVAEAATEPETAPAPADTPMGSAPPFISASSSASASARPVLSASPSAFPSPSVKPVLFPTSPPLPEQPDILLARGLTPAELMRRLGALPGTVRPRTRRGAVRSGASLWAAGRPLVRADRAGEWAYAVQESGVAQFPRPEVLRLVSAGTRALALTKSGPGVAVTVAEEGVLRPEEGRRIEAPREGDSQRIIGPAGAQSRRLPGFEPWPDAAAAYTRLLTELTREYGIALPPLPAGDLPSALLLPHLDDLEPYRRLPMTEVRQYDLAGLFERTEPRQLRTAFAAQLARLAEETRLDTYPEIAQALVLVRRDTEVPLAPDDPLDLRLRTLAAETRAAQRLLTPPWSAEPVRVTQDDRFAWSARERAAQALSAFIRLPLTTAAGLILHERISPYWRDELAADLDGRGDGPGCLGLPPVLPSYP